MDAYYTRADENAQTTRFKMRLFFVFTRRDKLAKYFINNAGKVEWQDKCI
jgi:hypothetical protein